jgi:hypothetical protein
VNLDVVVCNGVRLHSIAKQPTSCESDLSGPIPADLGNLTSLSNLWLHNNQLSGDKHFLLMIVHEMCADVLHSLLVDMYLPPFLKTIVDCPSSFLKLKKAKIDLRGNHFGRGFDQIIERSVGEVTKY